MLATGKLIMGGVEPPPPPEYEAVMVAADYAGVVVGFGGTISLQFGSLSPDNFIVENTLLRLMYSAPETGTEYTIQLGYSYPDRSSPPPGIGWNSIHIAGAGMDVTLTRIDEGQVDTENNRTFSFSKATTVPFIDGETYYLKYT